uniref:Uncharacterized protein n=1 Tax=Strombidium inclinatum TaxID=197538 RepID=A0A7S3MXZ6_9SPIT|mmetsp:Transcript_26916/g.41033  ORF Transcript_26916/g.41033 Transcript_26916/m.41033 type:complete len:231 (+) Transcript_26916:48-740(+)
MIEEEEDAELDMNAYNDETVGLVKTLLRVQSNIVNIPGGTEHFDIYLAKEIYPALVPGLEELSREIDRLVNSEEGEIDDSIKQRFNPCIFLAEYLMRNNPNHGAKLQYSQTFREYARIEKIRRFFQMKKQKIYKHFCIQPYQANFTKRHIKDYVQALDGFLQMDGKLIANFKYEPHYEEVGMEENVQFEDLYEVLTKWAANPDQLTLSFEDFAAAEDRQKPEDAFKKLVL